MDYRDTLLLPKTDFPMRGNLPENEPHRYRKWFNEAVYERMKTNRENMPVFSLHDGPPYANGHTHIGHALNKILKDIIVKMNYFDGKSVRFVPGWDCHGLPIEQQVEKALGGKTEKEKKTVEEIRNLCRLHAQKFVNIQKDEFKALGIIADWDKPYLTMDYKFEANIYRALIQIAKNGFLIRRSKPIYWSWAERTALAEAEVEYEEKESDSIYVAFKLSPETINKIGFDGRIVIWTTTPWTLPANVGIALNPDENYVLTSDGYIVAEKLYSKLNENGTIKGEILKTFESTILENLEAINPLNGRKSQIILADHVSMDGGTGAVHTAPGHGEDDYKIGLKYNLDVIMPVDESGKFTDEVVLKNLIPNGENFVGEHVFKANSRILELLGDSLLKSSKIRHSYPHCWRSHTPLIFRSTEQWFISMDGEKNLRNIASNGINDTKFYPDSGRNRIGSMVDGRPDWCISRQRDWGVPIALFKNKKTGEIILDEKVLNFIAMIFEREGTDVWYSKPISYFLNPVSRLNADDLEKVSDILDVWFDSGSTWWAVLQSREYDAGNSIADLYLEGSDQHRGWFQSSLLLGSAISGKPPFKAILTHGFTVDERGEKMSKSRGNVVAPEKVLKQYGSEILRLWVATSDYQNDLKISDNILKQTAEQYKKLRNTLRFLLANVNDLNSFADLNSLSVLDLWILKEAKKIFDSTHESFNNYDFVRGFATLNNFIVNELSGIYLDVCKDRLYCDGENSSHRRGSQTAMGLILKSLIGLIAPILTYTADEILEYVPAIIRGEAKDIFDFKYFQIPEIINSFDFNVEFLTQARYRINIEIDRLKKEKIIKNSLEVVIYTDSEEIQNLDRTEAEDWFLVSRVLKHNENEKLASFNLNGKNFSIILGNKHKCPRCWKHRAESENELCSRCDEVVNIKNV